MSVNLGTAQGYLDLDISKFQMGLRNALAESQGTFKKMESDIGSSLKSVGQKMTSVGKSMTTYVTTPIVGAGAAAVKTAADFDTGMSKVQALSGATGKELDQLRDKAKEMGAKTKFSASESADAFGYMALAGWKTADMLDGIEGIMNLAAASGEDLASVSDIVTDSLTAFGMSAQDSAHFADVLASAMSNSNTDVAGLGEAFKYVGPVAGAFGYTVEDVSVALGTMANAGIKGSSMGTALRQALVQLTSPSETAAMYMKQFGISLFDANGNTKDLMTIMKDLRGTFKTTAIDIEGATKAAEMGDDAWAEYAAGLGLPRDEQEKLTAVTEIFGARSMPAILSIIQASDEDFNSLTESIYGASDAFDGAGTAAGMSQKMMDNLNGQITIIKSTLEGIAISIGEILMPKIRDIVKDLQGFLDKLNSMSKEEKEQMIRIAGIVAAIGPLLMIFGKLFTTAGTLVTTFRVLSTSFAATEGGFAALKVALGGISAPVLAVVAVIGVLVAALKHLWDTNEEFRNKISEIWGGIVDRFNEFCQGIVDRLNALGFNFNDITEVIGALWDAFCNTLVPLFEVAFSEIAVILDSVLTILTGILDVFIGVFTGNWDQVWNGVKGIFEGIWNGLEGTFNTVIDGILKTLEPFITAFGTSWEKLWDDVTGFFKNTWDGIVSFFVELPGNAKQWLDDFINAVIEFFNKLPYNVGLFIGETAGKVASWGVEMVDKANETGKNFLDGASSFLQQLPGKAKSFNDDMLSNAKRWATDMASNAKSAGSNVLNNVVNFVKQLPGKFSSFLTETLSSIASFATTAPQRMYNAAMNMFNMIVNTLKKLPIKMLSIGRDLITGLWNGITGAGDWLRNQISGFANGIIDGFTSSFQIGSPSKLMSDMVGRWLPPGIAEGFEKGMPAMLKDMTGEINDGMKEMGRNIVAPSVSISGMMNLEGFGGANGSYGIASLIDYKLLSEMIWSLLRDAPISPVVNVEMQDGDVYLDNERVGRTVAPIVSRVQAL